MDMRAQGDIPGNSPGAVAETVQSWSMVAHEPTGGSARDMDILFLHGMASGGWIWKPDFLAQFQQAGYRVWALTLPGRAAGAAGLQPVRISISETGLSLDLPDFTALGPLAGHEADRSLRDLAEDLGAAVDSIGRPVAVVAHSMGGAVAQYLMQMGRSPAATVLACAVPPYGMWRASWQMALTNPQLWTSMAGFSLFGLAGGDPDVLRKNMFPTGISDADFNAFAAELQDESLAAMAQSLGFPPFAPMPGPRKDVLVVGAGQDRLVPVLDVHATAFYYGTTARIVTQAGHALMLDQGAEPFAQIVLDWLQGR